MRSDELWVGTLQLTNELRTRLLSEEPRSLLQLVIDGIAPVTLARSCRVWFRPDCAEWQPSGFGPDDSLLPPADLESVANTGDDLRRTIMAYWKACRNLALPQPSQSNRINTQTRKSDK